MWSYYAVETFKRHVDDEQRAGDGTYEEDGGAHRTVPPLIRRHIHIKHLVQIPSESCNKIIIRFSFMI